MRSLREGGTGEGRPLHFFDSRLRGRRKAGPPRRRPSRRGGERQGEVTRGDVFVERDVYQTSSGTTIVHAQHYYRGLKVFRSSRVFKTFTKAAGRGRKAEARATPQLFRVSRNTNTRPTNSPVDAVAAALQFLKKRRVAAETLAVSPRRQIRLAHLVDSPAMVELRYGLRSPARLHLEIFPRPRGGAELAWILDLELRHGGRFHMAVSARGRRPQVLLAAQTNTCAFSADWVPVPGPSVNEVFPVPPLATPTGAPRAPSQWQSGVLAGGPNVSVHLGDDARVDALGSLRVDNPFVWCNVLHDFFAAFGFDSAHHAFEGGDPLRVERLDQQNPSAGQFDNHRDGWSPTMFLFASAAGPSRHAAVDPTVVIHEYTHGVSSRLVGGEECALPFVEPEALGFSEGLSDYFALTVVNHIDRSRGGSGSLQVFGGTFQPGGVRDYANFNGGFTPGQSDSHQIGKVWCGAMLAARAALVAGGASQDLSDRLLWQVSIDALKAMAPLCRDSLALTLAHAKDALVTAASEIEAGMGLPGASAMIGGALAARGI